VADPWSSDFAALSERSRHGLRPLGSFASQPKETKMRFFKSHPALAALVLLCVLGLVGGAAYAVVREVWVKIDPDKSAPEIEQDITTQLQQQGVPASVHVEKGADGQMVKLKIMANGSDVGSDLENLHINIGGNDAIIAHDGTQHGFRVMVKCHLDDAQMKQLQDAIQSAAMTTADGSGESLTAAILEALTDRGFHDVEVHGDDSGETVVVKAPPTVQQ
jgi:hypothetical protein